MNIFRFIKKLFKPKKKYQKSRPKNKRYKKKKYHKKKVQYVSIEYCKRCHRKREFKEDKQGHYRCSKCGWRNPEDW